MQYEMLDWDSSFFDFPVAKIIESRLGAEELVRVLLELRKNGVRLVYWPSDLEMEDQAMAELGGVLVDKKTSFVTDLSALDLESAVPTDIVEPFHDSMPIADLEELAVQSGRCSRFAVDPNIPTHKFESLYKLWMNNSLQKKIASEVLVIRESEKIVAMVTLGKSNGYGDIGLIAVDADYRGRKYGEILVRAAQKWFVAHGYDRGLVVTQGQNSAACNLYRKCGYWVEHVAYFYHFWLW